MLQGVGHFRRVDNCKIDLIEEFPCENKAQLLKREGFHIQNTSCVNKRIEGQTRQEHRENHKDDMKRYLAENKEKIAEQTHQYWLKNKERLSERKREKFVCEVCQGCYTRDHRTTHEKTLKHRNALLQVRSNTPSASWVATGTP